MQYLSLLSSTMLTIIDLQNWGIQNLMFDNIFLYLIVDTDVRQIVSSIQSAALNDGEIQTLIDLLLNRQSGADQSQSIESWNKVCILYPIWLFVEFCSF